MLFINESRTSLFKASIVLDCASNYVHIFCYFIAEILPLSLMSQVKYEQQIWFYLYSDVLIQKCTDQFDFEWVLPVRQMPLHLKCAVFCCHIGIFSKKKLHRLFAAVECAFRCDCLLWKHSINFMTNTCYFGYLRWASIGTDTNCAKVPKSTIWNNAASIPFQN